MSGPGLELRGVDAAYGSSRILHGIDLRLARGEVLCLLGLNGMGKTTLLRTIMGLVDQVSGQVLLDGKPLPAATYRRSRVGITLVPEDRRVFPTLSVADNLRVAVRASRQGESFGTADVLKLFPRLAERLEQLAGTMSGGEQQMLSVARALVLNPEFLLLDEPSEGLAPAFVETIGEAIRAARARGMGVLLVEQSLALAMSVGNQAVVIENGRIVMAEPIGTDTAVAARVEARLSMA